MMKKLRVDFDLNKCIGNMSCAKHSTRYFRIVEETARLEGSNLSKGVYTLTADCDMETAERLVKSGENCPVNAIGVFDVGENKELVSTKLKVSDKAEEIVAEYDDLKEFVMDPKGYFLIKADKDKKEIQVGFCGSRNKVEVIVKGKKPLEIYQTVIKRGLLSRMDHAAYLGRELQKAYIALEKGIDYVQDDELIFQK